MAQAVAAPAAPAALAVPAAPAALAAPAAPTFKSFRRDGKAAAALLAILQQKGVCTTAEVKRIAAANGVAPQKAQDFVDSFASPAATAALEAWWAGPTGSADASKKGWSKAKEVATKLQLNVAVVRLFRKSKVKEGVPAVAPAVRSGTMRAAMQAELDRAHEASEEPSADNVMGCAAFKAGKSATRESVARFFAENVATQLRAKLDAWWLTIGHKLEARSQAKRDALTKAATDFKVTLDQMAKYVAWKSRKFEGWGGENSVMWLDFLQAAKKLWDNKKGGSAQEIYDLMKTDKGLVGLRVEEVEKVRTMLYQAWSSRRTAEQMVGSSFFKASVERQKKRARLAAEQAGAE